MNAGGDPVIGFSARTGETIELPFDAQQDARFEAMLEEKASKSREKQAKEITLNVGGSF